MKRLFLYILVALVACISFAQTPQTSAQKKIYLLHANTLSFDKTVNTERQVLRGDVRFRQDSIYMYCDSAYFYESRNAMEAFSNVRVNEGDTLTMWCDSLSYDGNTLLLQLYDNVRLTHNSTILTTEYMTYNRETNVANYPYNGTIVDPETHMASQEGWYMTNVKEAIFRENVVLKSYDFSEMEERPEYPDPDAEDYKPRAILYSDSLYYNFNTSLAEMRGPSRIETDTATVYSTLGNYNTSTLQSHLFERSRIVSPGRFATGDTLYYDGAIGVGDGWGNIVLVDSIQNMKLTGEYMHYVDDPQSVLITGRALAMEYSDKDTLFLHADTLRAFTIIQPDSLLRTISDSIKVQEYRYDTIYFDADTATIALLTPTVLNDSIALKPDSIALKRDSIDLPVLSDSLALSPRSFRVDSVLVDTIKINTTEVYEQVMDTLRFMTAYYGVRYYREDMQGVCDSLHYSVRDSLATFVGNPVMWNTSYQITGDTIFAFIDETKSMKRAEIHNAAFLVQEKDTFTMYEIGPRKKINNTLVRAYDQIKGKDLVCYFDSAKIKQMDMSGNVQVIYYPVESDGSMTGLNQVVGSYMSVLFQNQQMEKLKIWPKPIGSLTPIQLVQPDILTLEGFRWMDYLRPKDPEDVFRIIEMKDEDAAVKTKPLFNQEELNGY